MNKLSDDFSCSKAKCESYKGEQKGYESESRNISFLFFMNVWAIFVCVFVYILGRFTGLDLIVSQLVPWWTVMFATYLLSVLIVNLMLYLGG